MGENRNTAEKHGDIAVSVIIPVYNAEKWLAQCLNSVCTQTLQAIEIICVNDGSRDGSLAILRQFAEKDGRVKIYDCENSGAANARNFALKKAAGEYIAFLDADDYYPNPDALQNLYNGAMDHAVDACGGLRLLDFDGEIKQHPLHRGVIATAPSGTIVEYRDFQEDYHYHGYLYKRKLIEDCALCFPDLTRYEDPVFFVNFMVKAKRFFVVPNDVYCYRKKKVENALTVRQTIDAIRGITENLRTSSAEKLAKLHYICIQRLNREYREDILRSAQTSARDILYNELVKADGSQDYPLIQTLHKDYIDGTRLDILKDVQRGVKPLREQNAFVRGIKCIKENGMIYTLHRIQSKIADKL